NYSTMEAMNVFGREGSDNFTVAPSGIPIFIDGGDPIGLVPGDSLAILAMGAAVAFFAGPENDEGTLQVAAQAEVSFDRIESVGPIVGPGPVLIVGTGADDDISIVARDASTHPALAGLTPGDHDFTVTLNA